MYKRLIKQVAKYENISIIDALIKVYNSFISTKIDDYNSSVHIPQELRIRSGGTERHSASN